VTHLAGVAGHRIDVRHDVEVDDAVVERGHKRIGERVREAGEVRIEARRIDDEEIGLPFDLDHRLTEEIELELLVFLDRVGSRQRQMEVRRVRELQVMRLGPVATVAHVLREGLLATVDVNRCDTKALIEQVNGQVERGGRLARATFLIAYDNDMGPAAVHTPSTPTTPSKILEEPHPRLDHSHPQTKDDRKR
jgi:hypothetical protein